MALPPPGPPPAEGAPTGSPERPAPRASAADVIEALVTQFSQRTAFVRELIQNALDAGAGHIHIELTTEAIPASARPRELDAQGDPATPAGLEGQAAPEDSLSAETVKKPTQPAHDRHLWVRIADDGEGMDREVIEQHLLVLFRSPKEDDRTRIGQFGVGFVSLFAVRPDQVIVDTARHGEHLRLVFDASRRYALAASDEPFEGTRVALRIPTTREQAAALADEVRAAVHHWCRYARADIVIEGDDPEWSWSYEQVRHDFTVDSPVQVLVEDEKFRAAVGLSTETPPFVGYYSHGLTLLETREAVIPGVCFRVESGGLEHTLTRDNVRRDGGHAAVCERLRQIVSTRLLPAYHEELARGAASPPDSDAGRRHDQLLALAAAGAVRLDPDCVCLRTATGMVLAPRDCRPRRRVLGWLTRAEPRELLWAPAGSPVAAALEARGYRVFLGPPELHPDVTLVDARATRDELVHVAVELAFVAPELVAPTPLVNAVNALLEGAGLSRCLAARTGARGAALQGRFAFRQPTPGAPERVTADFGTEGELILAIDHPAFSWLNGLDLGLAAPLAVHLAARACGDQEPVPAALLAALSHHDRLGTPP